MYDIIIIGGGCAGLTAALYAARAEKSVLILESENIGGQITASPKVENYPGIPDISGMDFSQRLFDQAVGFGAEFKLEEVLKIVDGDVKKVVTDAGEHEARAVIIASGVKHRKLGIENEDKLVGRGLSYCAVCDGAFFRGMDVAVVGGGSTAFSDALFLSAYCKTVYIIHRRDAFRAEPSLVTRAREKENIKFITNAVVVSAAFDKRLSGIEIASTVTDEKTYIDIQGLFVAIGHVPESKVYGDLVECDAYGYIKAGEDCKTSAKGIFAAGDCRTKAVRQLATAAADGAVCAIAACEYTD
ncbi:MAG: NAD(P)/FAD-dependent oxidoreductase [Oscillospiraceae bacterium]